MEVPQPAVPGGQPLAVLGGDVQHRHSRIHFPDRGEKASRIEPHVREQVDFVQQHQPGGAEHVRVLERLVVTLRHRCDQHLGSLTEIEERGADQVADVLDEDDRARVRIELGHRPCVSNVPLVNTR